MDEEEFNIDQREKAVWLVKIPSFLAERWQNVQDAGVELGRIRIYNENQMTISVPEFGEGDYPVPKSYNLIAGKVEHEATITPIIDQDYRRVMKARTEISAQEKKRKIVTIDDREAKKSNLVATGQGGWESQKFGPKKRGLADKKERMEKDALLDIVFKMYEEKQYYSFKQLADRTNQPHQYLKEILAEVCVLNKKGEHAGYYELNPDYVALKAE
ncbi:hypothetical protein HK103_006012 [Boothiomyces macroporosus]|uniref:Transcription initiation factor IIF subunit beta n=1 Tax=Boothiomyces macroporosus TaxID=261099 RepID=A0AAD5YAU0_9FUNG|nr:hypothetical protein HK103_006012 [Boothiomyces macroporosus]